MRLLSLISIVFLLICCKESPVKNPLANGSVQFITDWTFKASTDHDSMYLDASVPGSIYMDLLHNERIKDPFYGANEQDVQWISATDWQYKAFFYYDSTLYHRQKSNIVFEGIDTHAEIFVNDKKLFSNRNMFIKHSIPVNEYLNAGKNTVRVEFKSPIIHDSLKQLAHPFQYPDPRSFSRKAPYQYGWDWGPILVDIGIWKPVYIQHYNDFLIENVAVKTDSFNSETAYLELQIDLAERPKQSLHVESTRFQIDTTISIPDQHISIPFEVENPELWWPNGQGKAHLYPIELNLSSNNQETDTIFHFGIKTIDLVTKEDSEGESFYFNVNGRAVFAKGANYIPAHSFPSQQTEHKTRKLLKSAHAVGMNMLRVWGGGIYPEDYFFDLCDSLGLMVWQDFMFACNFYPADELFLQSVKEEVSQQIQRISGRASLALWCGNNEIDEAWHNWGYQESLDYGKEEQIQIWNDYKLIFDTLIPNCIDQYDPNTDYIPTSPRIGWAHEEALHSGDMHYWGVWWAAEPFEMYKEKTGRFMSEYGFQSFPDRSVVKEFMVEDSLNLESTNLLNHQKHPRGMELIRTYMERDFSVPEDAAKYIYVSQLVQERGMTIAIEAHRKNKPDCMGTLYWQLNDCWPVISWSSLDYGGNWKAFHYELQRLYAPQLIIIEERSDSLLVFISNDDPNISTGDMEISILNFEGKTKYNNQLKVHFNSNSKMVWSKLKSDIPAIGVLNDLLLNIKLKSADSTIAESNYFFLPPVDLDLKPAILHIDFGYSMEQGHYLDLRSESLIKNLYLYGIDGQSFSDNYFDLLPNTEKRLLLNKQVNHKHEFIRDLRVMSLNPAIEISLEEKSKAD